MRLAIEYYEKGEDHEAMDRFMEVMVSGHPLERPTANSYLNLISERMALGGNIKKAPPPGVSVVEDVPEEERRPVRLPEAAESKGESAEEPEAPREERQTRRKKRRPSRKLSKADEAVMSKEIKGKIANRRRVLLGQLRKYEEIRVEMANIERPRGVGVPTDLLFGKGTQFKKDSAKVLETLTHLAYSLGATQVVILPENAILGDAKIMDLRRTMAISSHFIKEGISPPRIRVNLLSSQVDIPVSFSDYRGIIFLFVYNQPLELTSETGIGAESGPPISLGVSPSTVDPAKDDGTIIEFSVIEPQSGLMSWNFQLRGPGERKGDDMVTIQQVTGSAPVFHQVFWNARKQYFGTALVGGRYECVLTATDGRNRTRKRHAWITVEGVGPKAPPPPVQASAKPELPPASLESEAPDEAEAPEPKVQGRTIGDKRAAARRKTDRRRRRLAMRKAARTKSPHSKTIVPVKPPVPESGSAADPGNSAKGSVGAVNYQVPFVKNTVNITPDGENILSRVADTMHYYPLDNINLVGYSGSAEKNSQSLASQRADMVSRLLIERHGMSRKRIQVQTKVLERESHKVEIYIVSGQR